MTPAPVTRDATAAVIVGCCNLVERDDRYLFVREAKASARSRFNFPAGKPDVGETLRDAAAREALEETGFEVAVGALVGIYHCPRTSEGFGVVNFVFASRVTGGELTTSDAHPEVRWFDRSQVAALGRDRLLRGTHIELAIDDHRSGRVMHGVDGGDDVVRIVAPSPLP